MRKVLLFLASLVIGASELAAEEFLGVEEQGADYDALEEERPRKQPKRRRVPVEEEVEEDSGGGDLSISGGLGAGLGQFRANLSVTYGLTRWIAVETSGYYYRHESNDATGTMYGPEVDLILRLVNPTIVTPFVGAGPGYNKWKREYEGEVFDDGGSMTANAFVGAHLRLTKHFGLMGQRKQITYLGDPPVSFSDRKTSEPRTTIATTIGFHISF